MCDAMGLSSDIHGRSTMFVERPSAPPPPTPLLLYSSFTVPTRVRISHSPLPLSPPPRRLVSSSYSPFHPCPRVYLTRLRSACVVPFSRVVSSTSVLAYSDPRVHPPPPPTLSTSPTPPTNLGVLAPTTGRYAHRWTISSVHVKWNTGARGASETHVRGTIITKGEPDGKRKR